MCVVLLLPRVPCRFAEFKNGAVVLPSDVLLLHSLAITLISCVLGRIYAVTWELGKVVVGPWLDVSGFAIVILS